MTRVLKTSKSIKKDPEFDSYLVKSLSFEIKQLKQQNQLLLDILSSDPALLAQYRSRVSATIEFLPKESESVSIPIVIKGLNPKLHRSKTIDDISEFGAVPNKLYRSYSVSRVDSIDEHCKTQVVPSQETAIQTNEKNEDNKENLLEELLNIPFVQPKVLNANIMDPENTQDSPFMAAFSTKDFTGANVTILKTHIEPTEIVFFLNVSKEERLWTVEKSLKDIYNFDSRLRKINPTGMLKIAELPERAAFFNLTPSKRDANKELLIRYFQSLIQMSPQSVLLREFLTSNITVVKQSTMEGYLTKRGKNFGAWKARYYVLGSSLSYFDFKNGQKLGDISLAGARIARQKASAESQEDFRHAFLLVEENSSHHILCAESDQDREEWLTALLKVIQSYKKKPKSKLEDFVRSQALPFSRDSTYSKESLNSSNNSRDSKASFSSSDNKIINHCIAYIEKNGMATEGIYRVAASSESVDQYRTAFTLNQVDLEQSKPNVHIIANLLKEFIKREGSLSEAVEKAIESKSPGLRDTLLESEEFELVSILEHLNRVSGMCKQNKMTVRSLALIFSASLNIPCSQLCYLIKEIK